MAELDDDEPGIERAARDGDRIVQAMASLDGALEQVRRLASTTIGKFGELAERPDDIELEFGLRLNAQAGAVIARTEAEVTCRSSWHGGSRARDRSAALVGSRADGRQPGGRCAGMLVDQQHVVTCAHVVNQALGRGLEDRTPPDQAVWVDFPEAEASGAVPARSAVWVPIEGDDRGDLCVPELSGQAPAGTRAAPLRRPVRLRGHRFDTYGFPRGFDHGVGSAGEIGRPTGPGREWVQLEGTRSTGHRIERGFSGAPVWDEAADGVVGIVVTDERDPQARVAFMLPVRELAPALAPLGGAGARRPAVRWG